MSYYLNNRRHFRILPQGLFKWVGFITVILTCYGLILSAFMPDTQQPVKEYIQQKVDIPLVLPKDALASIDEQNPFSVNIKKSKQYYPIITKAAARYEVDPNLIKAIIMVESSYNPQAVSRVGAKGLMQLMPRTARAMGVEDCFDPEHNINGGVRYFKWLLNKFDGNIELSLAAYNAGRRKVLKYNGIPPFKDTQQYVKKVDEYYTQYYKLQIVEELNRV